MSEQTPNRPGLPAALDVISIEALTKILTKHRRNDVIEPDHSPGGSLSRTRIKCDDDTCDFYGVYDTWFLACRAFEEHLAEVLHKVIVKERGDALRQAAHHYGVIWGSGVTTEENVAMVLSWWADHGVGARIDPNWEPA